MGLNDDGKRVIRIGIIMALGSTWARDAVLRMSECGLQAHAIAISPLPEANYLDILNNEYDEKSIALLRERSVTVHLLKTQMSSYFRYVAYGRAVHTICKEYKIDALLLLGGGGFATAAFLSGFRPYTLYTIGSDVLLTDGVRQKVNRITYRAARLIFANGHYLGERTKALTGRQDVRSLYLGIDTNRFIPSETLPSCISILCNRCFDPVYNNEYLLEGLAELDSRVPYDEVVFTSAGPHLSLARAKAAALPANIARRVHFLGGGVSDNEMLARLQRATVYVSLSRSDGTSISFLEALSCGLFPVVSDIPQNREWIDPKLQNGLLVPLDRPKELAKALERALTDRFLRERASAVNRQIILDRADAYKNMAKLVFHLKEIISIRHN